MCLIYKTSQDFHDNSVHMYILRLRNYPVEIFVNNNNNIWVFLISIANTFSEKCFFVWWFRSDTNKFLLASVVTSLISLCFLKLSMAFPQPALFINLKKSFSKSFFDTFLRSLLISVYGFTQDFWLNLIIFWMFFSTNP